VKLSGAFQEHYNFEIFSQDGNLHEDLDTEFARAYAEVTCFDLARMIRENLREVFFQRKHISSRFHTYRRSRCGA
jgi:hypothetical protein